MLVFGDLTHTVAYALGHAGQPEAETVVISKKSLHDNFTTIPRNSNKAKFEDTTKRLAQSICLWLQFMDMHAQGLQEQLTSSTTSDR